jgi:aminoglycoside phosphotransferase (APT) family kinase protein
VRPDPLALYQQALEHEESAAGFYNHNIRLDTDDGPVIVRIPIPGAATMDLTIWHEADVLTAVRPYVPPIPTVRHVSTDPPFQIHDFVTGDLIDDIAPRGTRLAPRIIDDVIAFLGDLVRVPTGVLPAVPAGWPVDGDVAGFARRLSDVTATVYATYRDEFADLFTALGIPADPLAPVLSEWGNLTTRPFRLVHADVHRKNMIDTGKTTVFLDWELALLGDPLYDLAVHLHKMAYQPDEHDAVVSGWARTVPPPCAAALAGDLPRYLTHERIKSAIVDTVRYTTLIHSGTLTTAREEHLIDKLSAKLTAAYRCWHLDRTYPSATVADAIRSWIAAG